ncbi:MAG: DUF2271 domain-containing protein [Acidobacteriota bacterium]|nr:DUF2271 domain-containing protein [Acidobacteriota bacterium]
MTPSRAHWGWLPVLAMAATIAAILPGPLDAASPAVEAPPLELVVTIPQIQAHPYHRPYIAVWIETPERNVVRNLVLWYEEDTWLKDLRQWWRVYGRYEGHDAEQKGVDGFSGATRRPNQYTVDWNGLDDRGAAVPAGRYVVRFEASREEGGRSYLELPIEVSEEGTVTAATPEVEADGELGPITVRNPASRKESAP